MCHIESQKPSKTKGNNTKKRPDKKYTKCCVPQRFLLKTCTYKVTIHWKSILYPQVSQFLTEQVMNSVSFNLRSSSSSEQYTDREMIYLNAQSISPKQTVISSYAQSLLSGGVGTARLCLLRICARALVCSSSLSDWFGSQFMSPQSCREVMCGRKPYLVSISFSTAPRINVAKSAVLSADRIDTTWDQSHTQSASWL